MYVDANINKLSFHFYICSLHFKRRMSEGQRGHRDQMELGRAPTPLLPTPASPLGCRHFGGRSVRNRNMEDVADAQKEASE